MEIIEPAMQVAMHRKGIPHTAEAMQGNIYSDDSSIYQIKPLSADDAVEQAFKRGEWMTNKKAIECYGCFRFRTLMSELRQIGWVFHSEWVDGENRYGNPTRFKKYKLIRVEE